MFSLEHLLLGDKKIIFFFFFFLQVGTLICCEADQPHSFSVPSSDFLEDGGSLDTLKMGTRIPKVVAFDLDGTLWYPEVWMDHISDIMGLKSCLLFGSSFFRCFSDKGIS
jgi:hypothetical protein